MSLHKIRFTLFKHSISLFVISKGVLQKISNICGLSSNGDPNAQTAQRLFNLHVQSVDVRLLVSLDTSAWSHKRCFCAYAISTKIL